MTSIRSRSGVALSLFSLLALTACTGGSDTTASSEAVEAVEWDVYVQECLADVGYESRVDGKGGLTAADTSDGAQATTMTDDELFAAAHAEVLAQESCTDEWLEKYPPATVPIAKK